MADIGAGPFTDHGARIVLGEEMAEDKAQALTNTNYEATLGKGKKRPEPTVGALINGGWGLTLRETLQLAAGNSDVMNDVLTVPAYNLGANGEGGTTWLVPVSRYYDAGAARYRPTYRRVQVYVDTASQSELNARLANDKLRDDLAAKQRLLDLANASAAQGDIDLKIAIANGKAGKGLHAMELSFVNNSLLTAVGDYDSAQNHGGTSAIPAGRWEELAGTKLPADFNLPKPILDASDGIDHVKIGTDMYRQVVAAANEAFPDQVGHYSTGWKTAALLALQSLSLA